MFSDILQPEVFDSLAPSDLRLAPSKSETAKPDGRGISDMAPPLWLGFGQLERRCSRTQSVCLAQARRRLVTPPGSTARLETHTQLMTDLKVIGLWGCTLIDPMSLREERSPVR